MNRRAFRPVPLTVPHILAWADAYHARTGAWPSAYSGLVEGAPGETWRAIDCALHYGRRGLPGADSLSRLLRREGRIGERRGRPARPERRVLATRLHAQGLSFREVGRQMGISRQAAWFMLRTARAAGISA
jgi:hypothetical protein